MSERSWEQYRGCHSKFRDVERPPDTPTMRHYRCRFCGGWHGTSKKTYGRNKKIFVDGICRSNVSREDSASASPDSVNDPQGL